MHSQPIAQVDLLRRISAEIDSLMERLACAAALRGREADDEFFRLAGRILSMNDLRRETVCRVFTDQRLATRIVARHARLTVTSIERILDHSE